MCSAGGRPNNCALRQQFDKNTACAKDDNRTELWVTTRADDELQFACDHRLDRNASDTRGRHMAGATRQELAPCLMYARAVCHANSNAADIALVGNVGRDDFHDDGITDLIGKARGVLRCLS